MTCVQFGSLIHNLKMEAKKLDFSSKVESQSVYDLLFKNYGFLGRDWIAHQWTWVNGIYEAFNDHTKFLIIISLVEKTLNFYHQRKRVICQTMVFFQ